MKYVICKDGEAHPGIVTVTLQRGESTAIIKGVPGDVCDNCGEYYLSDAVTQQVLDRADRAVENGPEVEIVRPLSRRKDLANLRSQTMISKRRLTPTSQ